MKKEKQIQRHGIIIIKKTHETKSLERKKTEKTTLLSLIAQNVC